MLFKRKGFSSLVVFCFFHFLEFAATLQQGDRGVCVVKISVQKTRSKMVPTGRMCGRKKCTTKRIEYYSSPEEKVICCNGWEYDLTSDTCGPVCTTGCSGGRCVAPDVCLCDPPTYLDPEHKNACLVPKCVPPCVNAECSINNTCTCNPEHTRFNSSHCILCNSGYTVSESFECAPVCKNCPGICFAPHVCKCPYGYRMTKDEQTCEPRCRGTCQNGVCSDADECICNEGFVKSADNPLVCERNCELPKEEEIRYVFIPRT